MGLEYDIKDVNYDDFIGDRREEDDSASGLFSPFTFFCIAIFIVVSGLWSLYSASMELAIRELRPHYYYFIREVLGAVGGLVVGAALYFIPLNILKRSSYFLAPLSLLSIALYFILGQSSGGVLRVNGVELFSIPLLISITIISLLSYTLPKIEEREEQRGLLYILVAAVSFALAIPVAFISGLSWYLLIVLTAVSIMPTLRVQRGIIVLSLLLSLLVALVILFLDKGRIEELSYSILPLSNPELYSHELFTSQMAIRDGGFFGVGLGMGSYKRLISGVEGEFIFSSYAEETGFLGISILVVLMLLLILLAVRAARRAKKKGDSFIASSTLGLSLIIVYATLFNLLYCTGCLPLFGVMLPFFSYGIGDEAIFVMSLCILYRYIYWARSQNDKAK